MVKYISYVVLGRHLLAVFRLHFFLFIFTDECNILFSQCVWRRHLSMEETFEDI